MAKNDPEDGWHGFLKQCAQIDSPEQLKTFLDFFLTLEEKDDLAKRYLLTKALLKEEKTQREISEALKISISKITRGSNALKTISNELREFLINRMD